MQEEKNKISLDDKIIKWISKNLFYSFLILLSIIIIVLLIVFFITAFFYKDKTILNPNEIGDAIGGLTAPIIGLFSAFLVYIAFRAQIKANEELQEFNKKQVEFNNRQSIDLEIRRFENMITDITNQYLNFTHYISNPNENKSRIEYKSGNAIYYYLKDIIEYLTKGFEEEGVLSYIETRYYYIINIYLTLNFILNELNKSNSVIPESIKHLFYLRLKSSNFEFDVEGSLDYYNDELFRYQKSDYIRSTRIYIMYQKIEKESNKFHNELYNLLKKIN